MITEKTYDSQPKYRCILRVIYDPTVAYDRRADDLRRAGYDDDDVVDEIGPRPAPLSDHDAIMRTVDYVFDPARSFHPEGRFNTETEPALYTARTDDTAYAERRHHWFVGAGGDPEYCIFSLAWSGRVRDLRDEIAGGHLAFPEAFPVCQGYATDARTHGFDGLAAPSKRDTGGSCCALFHARTLSSGSLVRVGRFV